MQLHCAAGCVCCKSYINLGMRTGQSWSSRLTQKATEQAGRAKTPLISAGWKGRCQKVNVPRTWHCPQASHQACDIGVVLVEGENHGSVGAGRDTQDAKLGILIDHGKELQCGTEGF